MTNEEMERAIEFLLKSQAGFEARQANFEAQLERTSQQVESLAQKVESLAQKVELVTQNVELVVQMHGDFTGFVRGFMEAQSEMNQSLRETVRALTIAQARTDERLSNLERGAA
jgi:uncharacterized protein YukE